MWESRGRKNTVGFIRVWALIFTAESLGQDNVIIKFFCLGVQSYRCERPR